MFRWWECRALYMRKGIHNLEGCICVLYTDTVWLTDLITRRVSIDMESCHFQSETIWVSVRWIWKPWSLNFNFQTSTNGTPDRFFILQYNKDWEVKVIVYVIFWKERCINVSKINRDSILFFLLLLQPEVSKAENLFMHLSIAAEIALHECVRRPSIFVMKTKDIILKILLLVGLES